MSKTLKILMLEDSAADAELNEIALREAGVDLVARRAGSTGELERALLDFSPDLVLSELGLDGTDCLSALALVRESLPRVPIIFVTGAAGEDMVPGILEKGAADFVPKNGLSRLAPAVMRAMEQAARIEDRDAAARELAFSEERYRAIFHATGIATFTMDENATVLFVNDEFERMCGLAAADVNGKIGVADLLADDIEKESFRLVHKELLGMRSPEPLRFEAKVRLQSGEEIDVLINMALLPDSGIGVVSLIDISREKSYEEQLEERAGRLREFLTVASHELRQPITIIQGYTATLNQFVTQLSPESVREIYAAMNSSAERLTRIVEELMDVNRIEKEEVALNRRPCDFSAVLGGAVEAMVSRGARNGFAVATSGLSHEIFVDPERISQCLMALLENAVNFSPGDTPVDITADLWHDMLEVRVMDRGPGVPEGSHEKVFERFFQVEDAIHHSRPGIGLGLYIAHEIVSAHGGTITCEERPGGGSIFRFNIPC
jgi:PAS domain S-box-containing protein